MLENVRLAVFLSFVMRFSCLLSDLVIGGCSLVFFSVVGDWVIGHICCAHW